MKTKIKMLVAKATKWKREHPSKDEANSQDFKTMAKDIFKKL